MVLLGRIPNNDIFDPLYILSIISRKPAGEPDISSPTSKPRMPSFSTARAMVSPREGFTVSVAPILRAIFNLYSLRSLTTMYRAPAKRQMAVAMLPIRPAPVISTSSAISGKERAVCVALPKGSMIEAISSGIRGSSLTTFDAGSERYSAKAPSRLTPTPTVFSHTCNLPRRQLRQCPQAI